MQKQSNATIIQSYQTSQPPHRTGFMPFCITSRKDAVIQSNKRMVEKSGASAAEKNQPFFLNLYENKSNIWRSFSNNHS